jgi:hypothetical protein
MVLLVLSGELANGCLIALCLFILHSPPNGLDNRQDNISHFEVASHSGKFSDTFQSHHFSLPLQPQFSEQ